MEEVCSAGALLGEVEVEEAGDVVDDAEGFGDFGVGGVAHGFEAHALEADDGFVDGEAVLEGEGEGAAEGLAHAGDHGAFFAHFDEDLTGAAVGVEADGEVALEAVDGELVGEAAAGGGEDLPGGEHGVVSVERFGTG